MHPPGGPGTQSTDKDAVPTRRRFSGLRARLTLLFLVGSLPVVVAIIALLGGEHQEALRHETEKLRFVVQQIETQQELILDFGVQLARIVAADPRLQHPEAPECPQILAGMRRGRETHVANIAIFDMQGIVLCSATARRGPAPAGLAAVFAVTLLDRDPLVADIIVDPIVHKPAIPILQALRRPDGGLVGVVVVAMDQEWLETGLHNMGLSSQHVVGLVDRFGRIVYHAPHDATQLGRDISRSPRFMAMRTNGFNGLGEDAALEGREEIYAYAPYGKARGTNLAVWVSEPMSVVHGNIPAGAYVAGGATLALLWLLLVMLWWAGQRFVLKPVAALSQAARQLGAGDFTTRTRVTGVGDELELLGETFNAMASSLAQLDETVRANRALKVLLAVRGTRAKGGDEDEKPLYEAICRAIVETDTYAVAWIGLVRQDDSHCVDPVAGWGADPSMLNPEGMNWEEGAFSKGPAATAIREARIVTFPELAMPEPSERWYPMIHDLGLKSAISLPLYDGDRLFGALTMFAKEVGAFTDLEAQLLAETAADIAAKVDALRTRRERRLAQEALRTNETLLARAERLGHAGSWSVDFATGTLAGSAGFYRILETNRASFDNTPAGLLACIHPDDRAEAMTHFAQAVETTGEASSSFRLVTAKGNTRHVQVRGLLTFDEAHAATHAIAMLRDITAEVQTRAALADREAIYMAMASQALDSIAMVNPRTGRFVEFNDAAARNLGYTRAEFAALSFNQLDVHLNETELAETLARMMQPDGASVETRLRQRDRTIRDVRVSAKPASLDGETYLAVLWTDVTDAKATEAALRRVNREQRMLAAANRAILFAADETTLLRSVCDAMVEVGGYALAWTGRAEDDEARSVTPLVFAGEGQTYVEQLHISWGEGERGQGPTGRAMRSCTPVSVQHIETESDFAPWRAAALAHGYASSLTLPMLATDDRATMCLVAYSTNPEAFDAEETRLLVSLAENLAFGLTALRDSHARRLAEAENRKLFLAVEQSPESIAISDLEARIEYVNPAFLARTGYTREEVLGQNPRVLQSGKTPPERYTEMWARLTRGETWQGEFVNKRKDGTEYTELASIAPIRQEDGKITHYLAIKDDITDRKRMADELEEHRLHLEELVVSRTAQLADAQQHAEAANLAKSTFLANMSHEIRTPMNAILGMTHLLEINAPRRDQADRLRKIDRSARHLLSIVNDILDLSKVEAGKLRIEQEDFALADVLSGVTDALGDRALEKGLTFTVETGRDLPQRLCGDSLRLSQILLNLGTNAVKFTTSGHVKLRVQRVRTVDGGQRLRFEMEDSGIGLAPEHVGRLFQPFEQADVSTTRKYGGTGLGLAICRRLVDLLGGEIGVQSTLGAGSTFWFEVPFAQAQHHTDSGPQPSLSGVTRAIRAGVPPDQVRLLLVEDDTINQEVATDLLHAKGFHVDVAENGLVALQRAAARHYDAILMDVQMPVMDGLTATRELRRRAESSDTPILAMTANAFAEDRDACRDAGMDDFVAKPIQPDTLFATICRWTGAVMPARTQPLIRPITLAAANLRERLTGIAGLNLNAGLRIVQGDWTAYERLLRRFCDQRAGAVESLRAELAATHWVDAQRLAHTLKGVAGTLGAEKVERAAARTEHAISHERETPRVVEESIAALEQELGALVTALRTSLPDEPLHTHAPANWPVVRLALAELESLLEQDDARALQVFHAHLPALEATLGPLANQLLHAVEAFDFEVALKVVRTAKERDPDLMKA